MSDFTKIEAYTGARSFAWETARHRVMYGHPIAIADHGAFLMGLLAEDMRYRAQFGGRRSGKTEAIRSLENGPIWFGFDMGREAK